MATPHKQLEAWNVSMSLVKAVYGITGSFPAEERFGLSQQMRRSAVSIPSNIAEGAAQNSPKEYAHFISIARGSLADWILNCRLPSCWVLPRKSKQLLTYATRRGDW